MHPAAPGCYGRPAPHGLRQGLQVLRKPSPSPETPWPSFRSNHSPPAASLAYLHWLVAMQASRPRPRARRPPRRLSSSSTKASCRRSTASRSPTSIPRKDACTDFGGYVNGKWLAANPIPGDRTSVGRVRDAAPSAPSPCSASWPNRPRPTTNADRRREDRRRLLGHRHGRGARSTPRASSRSKARLAAIDALDRRAGDRRVPAHQRTPRARTSLFGFGPRPTSRIPTMNIAYADPGRPRPAGQDLLLRRRQEGQAATRTSARRQGARAVRRRRPPMPPSRPRT